MAGDVARQQPLSNIADELELLAGHVEINWPDATSYVVTSASDLRRKILPLYNELVYPGGIAASPEGYDADGERLTDAEFSWLMNATFEPRTALGQQSLAALLRYAIGLCAVVADLRPAHLDQIRNGTLPPHERLRKIAAMIRDKTGGGEAQRAQDKNIFPTGLDGIDNDLEIIARRIHDAAPSPERTKIAREFYKDDPNCNDRAKEALHRIAALESQKPEPRIVLPHKRSKRIT